MSLETRENLKAQPLDLTDDPIDDLHYSEITTHHPLAHVGTLRDRYEDKNFYLDAMWGVPVVNDIKNLY